MTCPPKKMPPGYLAGLTPCARLDLLEEAAFALASGQTKTQVRHGELWVEYGQGSITYLRTEIARLRAICGNRTAITIGRTRC